MTLIRPKLLPLLLLMLLVLLHTQTTRPPEGTRLDRLTGVVEAVVVMIPTDVMVTRGEHAQLKTPKRWERVGVLAPIKLSGM